MIEIKVECGECGEVLEAEAVNSVLGDVVLVVEPCRCAAGENCAECKYNFEEK